MIIKHFKDFEAIWIFNGAFYIKSKGDIFIFSQIIFSQKNHPPIDITEEQLKMMMVFQ